MGAFRGVSGNVVVRFSRSRDAAVVVLTLGLMVMGGYWNDEHDFEVRRGW